MIVALAHAFVASRIDHCCSVLVGLPLGVLERLDWGLRSAARLIERVSKMLSLSAYMRDVSYWLPVSQRILSRITALVSRCVLGGVPSYFCDLCRPVAYVAASLCYYGRGTLSTGSLGYHAAPCIIGCGPVHLEWPPT